MKEIPVQESRLLLSPAVTQSPYQAAGMTGPKMPEYLDYSQLLYCLQSALLEPGCPAFMPKYPSDVKSGLAEISVLPRVVSQTCVFLQEPGGGQRWKGLTTFSRNILEGSHRKQMQA